VSDSEALSLLSSLSPALHQWCDRFLQPSPLTGRGDIEFKRGVCDGEGMVCVSVDKVHDIEENIWSPRLGLKGKVDATLQIKMRRGKGAESSHRVPLEIKTGKMFRKQGTLEHRAQLSLYSLMLRDRYGGESIPGGLLYYMKAGHMQGLPAEDHDIRSLLMARNAVAGHRGSLASHMTLPGMLRDSHVCQYCPHLPHCCLTHRSLEGGTAETSGLGDLFDSHTQHLSQEHLGFFSHWSGLVMREEGRERQRGSEFWNHSPHDREAEGLAMADMLACRPQGLPTGPLSRRLQKFVRKRTRHPPHSPHSPHPHHPHTLTPNERMVVSRQDGTAWAVAMGMVTMATDEAVELLIDKPVSWDGTEYRLDVAPSYYGSASLVNLARLCGSDSERYWNENMQ
jgi:DNA replication ATP-dependent helicase Dna2